MMGGAKAHYDGIVAFSQTDFTEDLKTINVPVLVIAQRGHDQIVPYVAAGPLSAKLIKHSTFKSYKDFPHGMPTTHAETINRGPSPPSSRAEALINRPARSAPSRRLGFAAWRR